MMQAERFYIGGEWVDPHKPVRFMDVINPATEQCAGRVAIATAQDVDRAVQAAAAAVETWGQTSVAERQDLLRAVLAAYKRRIPQIGEAIKLAMGAPAELAHGAQALSGIQHLKAAIDALQTFDFDEVINQSRILREPVGVCGLITPWNWPANQIACKVAPALAAGCTMVLKPSEVTPFDATYWADCMHEAGVPPGVFNLVQGDGTTGASLSQHPRVDMMSFTGSTRAGVAVSHAAADSVKRVALELGGKSPNIILDDADLDKVVAAGVAACFYNTGQSCNAPTRMLVPEPLMDAAAAIAARTAQQLIVGDPDDSAVFMGPLSSRVQFEKVQRLIQTGIDEGATLISGGPGRPAGLDTGYYAKPTVFANVRNDMTIAQEEIFGPVLCIIGYSSVQDAIAIANDTPYGLSAYVQSGDGQRALAVARQLRAGMVHINGADLDTMAPFGGYKQSGLGREWGPYGIEEFLEVKAVMGAPA
ncbi:MAG: aldehyde dehydrogenase family protein [Gammaproteobacteria bacterium]|nr:aldehyde dehydrogenase family protein [Gammaproteobacteria bacterium]